MQSKRKKEMAKHLSSKERKTDDQSINSLVCVCIFAKGSKEMVYAPAKVIDQKNEVYEDFVQK